MEFNLYSCYYCRYVADEVTLEEVNRPPNRVHPQTRVLTTPLPYSPVLPIPEGASLYRAVEARVRREVEARGDFTWLCCRLTKQTLGAGEALDYAKR